jgi:hypothetical protein
LQAARAHWPLDVAVKTAINAAMSIDAVPLHVKLWPGTEQRDRSKAERKTKDGRVRVEPKGPNPLRNHDPALISHDGITTTSHSHSASLPLVHFRPVVHHLFLLTHLSLVPLKGAD